jgi:hypothetical protein
MKSISCFAIALTGILASPMLSLAQESAAESNTTQLQRGYGGTPAGGEQTGSTHRWLKGARHDPASDANGECVGPVSYCNLFFGS